MSEVSDTLNIAAELGQCLQQKKWMLTTAESCTGGGISYYLTGIAGSSAYIDRCFVTYSNKAKQQLLGVKSATLLQFGAVSEETATEMASGAAKATGADVAIAVSGIAGPGGGSVYKPVGTVCFGFCIAGNTVSSTMLFHGDRHQIRQQAINYALQQTILLLTGITN